MNNINRRDFFRAALGIAGFTFIMPAISACDPKADSGRIIIPMEKPKNWNPVEFNRLRGNNGAVPQSYLAAINGPDGDKKHIGKHLPYIPKLDKGTAVPEGYLPIMWGDPSKGHTPHSNAVPGPDNDYLGHWYNRIEIRKAMPVYAESVTSVYNGWPSLSEDCSGRYLSSAGLPLERDSGIHTVYLARLPADVRKGDTVRIVAHCLTHGEYVDFLTV